MTSIDISYVPSNAAIEMPPSPVASGSTEVTAESRTPVPTSATSPSTREEDTLDSNKFGAGGSEEGHQVDGEEGGRKEQGNSDDKVLVKRRATGQGESEVVVKKRCKGAEIIGGFAVRRRAHSI